MEHANLKAIKEIFNDGDEITIITCLFHLLQCWWRRAGQLGLRQKKFINDIKIMLFNFELLAFMKLEDARKYYKLVLEAIPKIDKFDEIYFLF